MARGRTFDQGERARVLFDAGTSCNGIAKELGVAASTISGWAKREGLSFDRKQTAKAVTAHRLDRAAARADIIDRLYRRSQKVLTRLEADKFSYRIPTEAGSMVVKDDDPPANDEKSLSAAVGMYLNNATRLELIDGNAGESAARSMLAELGEFLGVS